jgi:hypothetical protein
MYQIVRRQYIDPFDKSKGYYPNENQVYPDKYSSLKETKKAITLLRKEEGRIAKYSFGYINTKDLVSICHYHCRK